MPWTDALIVVGALVFLWLAARAGYRHGYRMEGKKRHRIVICDQCRYTNRKSKVYLENMSTATIGEGKPPYWDECGRYHPAVSNKTIVYSYLCSNGHYFTRRENA